MIKEKKTDFRKLLVLSLGTGSWNESDILAVTPDATWGLIRWFFGPENTRPLIDVLMASAAELVEMYMSSFFQAPGLEDNYIRIQVFMIHI